MRKGQTQIVSAILIVLIALGAVTSIIPWANSMIQKRKDAKGTDDSYNFFQKLDKSIRNIAENGGEESLQLSTNGIMTVYPASVGGENNNSIVFLFISRVSNVAEGSWVPLNTPNANTTATLGIDPSSVIFGRATKDGDRLKIEYKLWYRTLRDVNSGVTFKINLNTTNDQIVQSSGFLRIQRIGTKQVQNLTTTEINIIV